MTYTQLYAKRVPILADTTIRDTLALAAKPGVISLGGGIPNPALFPLDQVRQVFGELTDTELQTSLQYSGTQGVLSLRQRIAHMVTSTWGRTITAEHVLVTTGSQQALDLIGKAFIDPGDPVAIEDPSYLAAISAFQTNAPVFHPVPLHHDGPDIAELSDILSRHQPKLFYTIPTFQNPTGFVWSERHRKEVLALTNQQTCLVVEDDPYGELYFTPKRPPKPLAARDPSVIYLGSFSKTLLPGLRIGYIVADPELIDTLTLIKQSMDLHSPTFSQVLLEKLLSDQTWYQEHLSKLRTYYRTQQSHMVAALREHASSSVAWSVPTGGLFIWLKVPGADSRELLKKAVANGVAFMPGYPFYAGQPDYETIRLTFATVHQSMIQEAVQKISKL